MDNQLRKQLDAAIDELDARPNYRVDAALKSSATECTERVYLVEDTSEQGPFIRKIFFDPQSAGAIYERLFEAQKAGQHFEHLPRILDYSQTETECTVVMEYIAGHTLSDEVYERDASPQLAASIFPQVCDAVRELHESFDPPIIHRDIKPSNIMIAWSGVYLIDLGIARTFDDEARDDTRHLGTKAYAPPEQFGYSQTDERSDVYALGMLLYYLLTEENPDPVLAGSSFNNEKIPAMLRPILTRATSFDPNARYQSVLELKEAFVSASAGATEAAASSEKAHRRASQHMHESVSGTPTSTGNRVRNLLKAIPKPVGMTIDVLCVLWIVLIAAATVSVVMNPTAGSAVEAMRPAARSISGAAIVVLLSVPAFLIADRRPLYKMIPTLQKIPLGKQVAAALIAAATCVFVVGLAGFIPF
mgnify:CR=1 FL=1